MAAGGVPLPQCYTHNMGSAIPGNNMDTTTGKTAVECQMECNANPLCQGVDYATSRSAGSSIIYDAGTCVTNSASRSTDHSTSDGYMNLDSYVKVECASGGAFSHIHTHPYVPTYCPKGTDLENCLGVA